MNYKTIIFSVNKSLNNLRTAHHTKAYWLLLLLYLLYFLYSLIIAMIALQQEMLTESSWLNFVILDGLRIFGFVLIMKGVLFFGLLKTSKTAYFIVLAEIALTINYFSFSANNPPLLAYNLAMLAVFVFNWKVFDIYHPKFNVERRLLIILSSFIGLLFFQKFGFRLFKSSFNQKFGFIDLVTDYGKILINPSSLFSYQHIEPNNLVGWIFFYTVLFSGAMFLITTISLLIIPRQEIFRPKMTWNENIDPEQIDLDPDSLAVFKLSQNLDIFYHHGVTIYYKEAAKSCIILGDLIQINANRELGEGEIVQSIKTLQQFVHQQGKTLAFFQNTNKYISELQTSNLTTIEFAHEKRS